LFSEQVHRRGNKTAIIAEDESITYAELDARASAIERYLTPLASKEQTIGVFIARSVDMVAAMLGIWKAGCAYVPLDPNDPPDRNRRILEIAQCKIVLAHSELIAAGALFDVSNAEDFSPELVDVREISKPGHTIDTTAGSQLSASTNDSVIAPLTDGSCLAYVMFTSGSSGAPKGVEVEHHSLATFLRACRDLINFSADDCFLAVTTIGFDVSVAELFVPLICGGTIVLRGHDILLSPRRLAAQITEYNVTVFQAVPTIWSVIISEHPDFPKLRIAMNMGEAISNQLAEKLIPYADQVWNFYGPTEATVYASACKISQELLGSDAAPGQSAPIGQPLANASFIILDPVGDPVVPGERGELFIGGSAVARGYRSAPELTEKAFVDLGGDIGRVYRTGDVASQREDGEFLFFGRNDDQLKIRGARVEPGEIRVVLLDHPGVAQAAVTWFAKSNEARSIVATIVKKAGQTLDSAELLEWLGARLRAQMIPEQLSFVENLPRLPNGKIDYPAIRIEAEVSISESNTHNSQRTLTTTETTLIGIWESILHVSPIAVTDHFLYSGGDSLAAMQMISRVERAFGVSLPFRVIFENLQLDALAARIDGEGEKSLQSRFIFPLHEKEGQRPLFFTEADFRLAGDGRWKVNCPLLGIAHWAQEKEFLEAKSVADLARTHVVAIRQIQAYGPYRLAGYRFGAIVALETARQLEAQGETVEILFLLDPKEPGHAGTEGQLRNRPNTTAFERFFGWLIYNPLANWLNYGAHHVGRPRNHSAAAAEALPRNRWPAFWGAERRIRLRHTARACAAPVLAFFTERNDNYRIWEKVFGSDKNFRTLPAGHQDVFSQAGRDAWMSTLDGLLETGESHEIQTGTAIAQLPWQHPAVNAIRSEGSRPPFFAVGSHPMYVDAVQEINAQQPVYRLDAYALQSDYMARGLKPLRTIEEICEAFIDAIQAIQPEGPYYIGGGCEGALIGFAIATELQRRGEEVAQLILWITSAPGYKQPNRFGLPALARVVQQLKAFYRSLSMSDINLHTLREISRHEYIEYSIFHAMDKYLPSASFQGSLILARTGESMGEWDTDKELGWGKYISSSIEIRNLAGNHDTWLAEHAQQFGKVLNSCLEPLPR
jgi:amino acid adenylation domain-containing protein